jgi:predicted double-glycine peptidase
MYKVYAITNNQELESFHIFEHEAKHQAIDLAYQGYKTYVYFGDKHLGYSKLYRSEQFGQCFAVIGV